MVKRSFLYINGSKRPPFVHLVQQLLQAILQVRFAPEQLRVIVRNQPAENAFPLNFPYACPEPVWAN